MKKDLLLTPGPTAIPPEVLAAMALPSMHHRTQEFKKIFASVVEDMKYVYQTKYDVLLFAATGTGAMESAVTNLLSPGDKAICIRGGKFGERWAEICQAYGITTVCLDVPYGKTATLEQVKQVLDANPDAKAIYATQSETSTGTKFDVEGIGALCKDRPTAVVVDSITGLGGMPVYPEKWGLDVVCGGSQKALMLPPGLACVSISPKAWALNKESKLPKYYFNWQKEKKNVDKQTTAYTTPVSLVRGLRASLDLIKADTIEAVWKRTARYAEATRTGAKALGLRLFSECPSDTVTALCPMEGVDAEAVRSELKKQFDIEVAGGQASMKGKVFRVSHMGYVTDADTLLLLAALGNVLVAMGQKVDPGAGLAAAQALLTK